MKNFRLVERARDVQLLLDEIASVDGAWDLDQGRQDKIAVQREAQAIPIRGLVKSAINGRKRRDVIPSRYTTISNRFPVARAFLEAFAIGQDAELGRAKLVRLLPGHRVHPHRDRGKYYTILDRYHFVLRSAAGSYLKSGEEAVRMHEGEIWCFDNKQVHEAVNDGPDERIHFIFDLLTRERVVEARQHEARTADVSLAMTA